jgi:hypothetical protein
MGAKYQNVVGNMYRHAIFNRISTTIDWGIQLDINRLFHDSVTWTKLRCPKTLWSDDSRRTTPSTIFALVSTSGEILAYHQNGLGFGVMTRLYTIAERGDTSAERRSCGVQSPARGCWQDFQRVQQNKPAANHCWQ